MTLVTSTGEVLSTSRAAQRQQAAAALAGTISGQLDLAAQLRDERGRWSPAAGDDVELAGASVTVDPAAMKPPGLPVPDDPAAISMFTAHRVNSILHQLAHATERMQAAKAATGGLRKYHVTHIAEHLQRGLDSAHEMTGNLREHYPAEAAELEQVKDMIGLAYDPAEARGGGGEWVEMYHGTKALDRAASIKANGLTAERYGGEHPYNVLTKSKDEAGYFAGAHGAVVTVHVPADKVDEYTRTSPQGLTALKKPLPPSMIHKVESIDTGAELAGTITGQIDLAQAVSPTAKAVTTAHLLETTLHELAHADLHAQAMLKDPPGGDEWAFDADHCTSHLAGAVEHAGKIWEHFHDNYPAEAKWLDGIAKITHPLEAQQHTGDDATISGQLDLAAIHGRHIPGSAYTFRHGWIPLIGKQLVDKYPQWKIDEGKAGVRKATVRETKHADKIGKGHIKAAKEAVITVSGKRQLTRDQQAMIAVRDRSPAEIPSRIAPAPSGAAAAAAAAFQDLLPPLPPAAPGPTSIGSMHQQLQPQTIGGLHQQMAARDPALSALAGPGASEDALAKFIDARVAAEVARQMGQITPRQSADVKGALASMHAQQQKLIALLRRSQGAEQSDDDKDLEKHTISNTLFSFAGVAVAMGSLAIGLGPVGAALVAGIIPLTNVIHDYVRNLG